MHFLALCPLPVGMAEGLSFCQWDVSIIVKMCFASLLSLALVFSSLLLQLGGTVTTRANMAASHRMWQRCCHLEFVNDNIAVHLNMEHSPQPVKEERINNFVLKPHSFSSCDSSLTFYLNLCYIHSHLVKI